MTKKAKEWKRDFATEGATVRVPEQKDRKKVKIEKLAKDSLDKMKPKKGGFIPGRVVFNFQIVDEDDPSKILTAFDPPFELRVRYTKADQKRAQDAGKPLQLAFWNGSEWITFTKEKHQYELEPDSVGSGGEGVAMISHWGDPNVGWGP
jgi:hypothetical protein